MDSREVLVIGTIKAFPYILAAYPDKQLNISVLVVFPLNMGCYCQDDGVLPWVEVFIVICLLPCVILEEKL